MIISKKTAEDILHACDSGEMFIGVSRDISSEPVYAGVKDEKNSVSAYFDQALRQSEAKAAPASGCGNYHSFLHDFLGTFSNFIMTVRK